MEQDAVIIEYNEMISGNFEFQEAAKRIFIFNDSKYNWFLLLNPAKREYIKCMNESPIEIVKILQNVNFQLAMLKGIFTILILFSKFGVKNRK